MKNSKLSKKFLGVFLALFLSFLFVYSIAYNALVKKDSLINHSYKDFLLRHTNNPRLIIDSGSNSAYGINSLLLEKQLGLLTINIADNGSYPLREKIYRLDKFAKKGDIILLPIEWLHYFSTLNTPTIFFESLFSELHFYYHEMPLLIKLDLITNTPFSSVMRGAIKKITEPALMENHYVTLNEYTARFNQGDRGDYAKSIIAGKNNELLECNDYIFSQYLNSDAVTFYGQRHLLSILSEKFKKRGFVISKEFKNNVQLLKKLQQRGVHIIFTWPVVVGENCYQGEYGLLFSAFLTDIKSYLNQNGMLIVGEPWQSQFSNSYFFNSYYHVIPAGRDKRTQILIAELKKSKANDWFNATHKINYTLNINESTFKTHFINSLKYLSNKETIKSNSDKLFLVSGWYSIEPWGVWSKENESILYVKLEAALLQHDLQLTLENNLYKTHDKTTVLINDKKLGDYLLEGRKSIMIPNHFLTDKTGLVKIQFNYIDVKSPLEYGLNQDERKIKFGLKSLRFNSLAN